MTFVGILKNLFLLLLFLTVAPSLITTVYKQYNGYLIPKAKVGVITFKGTICDSTNYTKQLNEFFKDPEVKAIVLKMESSGGAAGSAQALYREILILKKAYPKPIVTLVENSCIAGAYYIASATDYIVSPGAALIGNIGNLLVNDQAPNDQTSSHTAVPQSVIDDTYSQCIHDIAVSRKLSIGKSLEWANKKLFSARQAFAVGLVDEIGSVSTVIKIIKERALLDREIDWVKPPKKSPFAAFLGSDDDGDENSMMNSAFNVICTNLWKVAI